MGDFINQRNIGGPQEHGESGGDRWLRIYSGIDLPCSETSTPLIGVKNVHHWGHAGMRFCLYNRKAMDEKRKGVCLK